MALINKYINWLIKEKYDGDKNASDLAYDIAKLKKGEPIDYVIGFSEFCSVKIDLRFKPMIPRAETEFWVNEVIEKTMKKDRRKSIKCLDIFAGSGCIGIAILKHIIQAKVDFADIESKFLKQILFNLKLNHIPKNRFKIIKSNIFSAVKSKYDYIFANPPYVPNKDLRLLPKSVQKFEPYIALAGGADGLFYIKEFLSKAYRYLNKNGALYMEFSSEQKAILEKFLSKINVYSYSEFFQDQYKRWRYLKLLV